MNRADLAAAAAGHRILATTLELADLPAECVDHVITDPPFSSATHENVRAAASGRAVRRGSVVRRVSVDAPITFEPITEDTRRRWAAEIARIVRRWVLVCSDVEGAHGWRVDGERAGLRYVRTMAWVRLGGTPQFTGDRPAQGHEAIVVFHAPGERLRWNAGGKRGVYTHRVATVKGEGRIHETQKPLGLMRELIRDFTDEGETVADLFAGSGTTVLAAKIEGRYAFGIERDADMARAASDRIAGAGWRSALGAPNE